MTTTTKTLVGVVVLASLLGVLAFFGVQIKSQAQSFGSFVSGQVQQEAFLFVNGFSAGSSQQYSVDASGNVTTSGTATLGSSGSAVTSLNFGKCNINAAATTIAASSTATVTCGGGTNGLTALSGVAAGASVQLSFATTTSTIFYGLNIVGVSASSTSGYFTAIVANDTGATYTWATGATTSLNYIAVR